MSKMLGRRLFLRSALAAPAILGLASVTAAQVPGRVNPLPGLTGLGANALPGLISPTPFSSGLSLPAGIATTWRWNPADMSVQGVLSNGNRTFTSLVGFSGVRGATGYATGLLYFEWVVDTLNAAGDILLGYATSTTSLTGFSGGAYAFSITATLGGVTVFNFANQTTATLNIATSNSAEPAANGYTFQMALDLINMRATFAVNGRWIGTVGVASDAMITGIAGATTYLPQLTMNTGAQVSIPLVTAYPAPPGYFVA